MSNLDVFRGKIEEMYAWYDYHGVNLYNVVYVSHETLGQLLKDIQYAKTYRTDHTRYDMHRVAVETRHATFFIDPDRDVKDDDLVMKSIDGFSFSYLEHYLNEMVERVLLVGEKK